MGQRFCMATKQHSSPSWVDGAPVRSASAPASTVVPMNEPVRLANADEARIPTEKLVRYAFNPTHERGRHKARVFASALGIGVSDWRCLHDQILGRGRWQAPRQPA
jgi:hypothetical protein